MVLINILFLKKMLIIVNPIIVMLLYVSLKPHASSQQRKKDAVIIFITSCTLAIFFIIAGKYILLAFDIGVDYISLTGGIMIIAAAWELLHSSKNKINTQNVSKSIINPIVVPVCIGGASISIILETTSQLNFSVLNLSGLLVAVVIVYTLSALACFFSTIICQYLAKAIMEVIMIFMAFMILAVGLNITINSLANIILGVINQ
jgi:multiple antibiotic resistance protein